MVSDMHTYLLRAVCDSFSVVKLGGAKFSFDHLMTAMTKYMTDLFVIGFRNIFTIFCMYDDP